MNPGLLIGTAFLVMALAALWWGMESIFRQEKAKSRSPFGEKMLHHDFIVDWRPGGEAANFNKRSQRGQPGGRVYHRDQGTARV